MAEAEDKATSGSQDMHPLLKDRLHRQRSVFSPGHRLRMNILPMFLNIFVPWGVFIFILGAMSFRLMYTHAGLGTLLLVGFISIWVTTVLVAFNRRKYDPEPAWYTYFSLAFGLAVFSGWMIGDHIFHKYTLPYYELKDMKVIGQLDANLELGQNVMDAGIVYFADGNKIDAKRSWHFKQDSVYCVAPIIKGEAGSAMPETQSFDFWAVGKDCCSMSSSDFRCGSYNNPNARSAMRMLGEQDRHFYRLAVEQAETLYGIMAAHPIFFEWSQDPLEVVNSWNAKAFTTYIICTIGAFVLALLGVACASCKFAWLGRSESAYGEQIYNDPMYARGGYRSTP